MRIANTFRVELPVAEAWRTLLDVPGIVTCMPGAELLAVEDERTFRGQVKVKLGPIAVAFQGLAKITEIDEAARQVRVNAKGTEMKGRGSAHADVQFRITPDGSASRVDVATDVNLAGSVAQYGRAQGIIADVAQIIVDQFAENLRQRIAASQLAVVRLGGSGEFRAAVATAPIPTESLSAASVLLSLLKRWLGLGRAKGRAS